MAAGILAALGCAPRPAHAQFIGFTSPQTVNQAVAASVACTGANQDFALQNLGQNQHVVNIVPAGVTQFQAVLIGGNGSTTAAFISDTVTGAGGILYAAGYFPLITLRVNCAGGTFSADYSGTSAEAPLIQGAYLLAQQRKTIFDGSAANANHSTFLLTPPPFGNIGASLIAQYTTASVAGSTLAISCSSSAAGSNFVQTFTLANNTGSQFFYLPPTDCDAGPFFQYTSGGATAGTLSVRLAFNLPGVTNTAVANYVHIANTTATSARDTAGVLTTLTVGTPDAGTVSVFDLPVASCTMTPSTNVVAVFTEQAMGTPQTHVLNQFFKFGICIKASVTMDITAGVQ